jgi:hypothetical protein
VGRDARRHCQDRSRVHQEPLRAGTVRRDPEGRRRHPRCGCFGSRPRRPTGGDDRGGRPHRGVDGGRAPGDCRLRDAEDRGRGNRRQRRRPDPPRAAGGLGGLALSNRLGRRGLLGCRGRCEGSPRGDRHRRRAGAPGNGPRRSPARFHPGAPLLAGVPPSARGGQAQGTPARVCRRRMVRRGLSACPAGQCRRVERARIRRNTGRPGRNSLRLAPGTGLSTRNKQVEHPAPARGSASTTVLVWVHSPPWRPTPSSWNASRR